MEPGICEHCRVSFLPKYRVTRRYWATRRFCSRACATMGMRGQSRSTKVRVPLEERFWAKVQVRGPDDCWPWIGSREAAGYGVLYRRSTPRRRVYKAHRLSWEIHNGSIPSSLFVCHHCDNPPCVNPVHLFLGTALDNAKDMLAKGRCRVSKGSSNGRAKLSEVNVRKIRKLLVAGRSQVSIAAKFGVCQVTISGIKIGRLWSHI